MTKKRLPQKPNDRLVRYFRDVERTVTGTTPKRPSRSWKELEERLSRHDRRKRFEWLNRPRLHTAIFEEAWLDDEIAKLGGVVIEKETKKRQQDRAKNVFRIAKMLQWSDDRLSLFKRIVVQYRKNPTLEKYLQVRQEFPEVDIQVGKFAGIESLSILEKEFQKHGIDPLIVADCLDADEPSIDALCLRMIEKLIEREKISNSGPGHIEKRRAAISDALINYLIVTIMESIDWNEREVRLPGSLVELLRHQLTGINPDLHATYVAKERNHDLAIMVAQLLKPGERLSVRKLASIADIPRIRAARLLKDEDFVQWFETAKKWVAEGLFEKPQK